MLKSVSRFLRLYFQKHQRSYAVFINNNIVTDIRRVAEDGSLQAPDPKTEELHNKILFSSYMESQHLSYGRRINHAANAAMFQARREEYLEKQRTRPYPISLQYLIDDKLLKQDKNEDVTLPGVQESSEFPYKLKENSKVIGSSSPPENWMTDYDYFDDATLNEKEKSEDILTYTDHHNFNRSDEITEDEYITNMLEKQQMVKNYGTPAADVPVSSVKCGGCGSLLHCKDTCIPGYVPSEIFIGRSMIQLKDMHCQRCHFLKEYNIALNVAVDPEEYPKLLKEIKPKRALVVLMVDLLDFPCSIWPGIMDIIGKKRPIIIVGNKVDLLPEDSPGYLRHIEECLKMSVKNSSLSEANIKHVSLISAKTGFGVEELINKLHTIWKYNGDVYLIGCTNVGKSTLFNALLQSDYCKVEAVDLLQRATISPWPGTTLNLLKFPILKPIGWRLQLRTKRLFSERAEAHAEVKLRRELTRKTGDENLATLMGHIGRTFLDPNKVVEPNNDPYSYQMKTGFTQSAPSRGISEKSKAFAESKWCYDTPGVIHPDQILTILTIEELMLTLPKALIRPRTFYLKKGSTLFVAGLARLDFLECEYPVRFTVFSSKYLPITVCKTEDADELYSKLLGTEYFAVPRGNEERLSKWPALKCSEDMKAVGEGWQKSVADVVLSSAGWISITAQTGQECTVRAWTPDSRGIHFREPSLIQYAADMKGKRIKHTPAYSIGKIYCKRDKIQFKI